MKSYSEDLRKKKIVAAVERGTSKSETARLFGVSLSSVKRYVGRGGQQRRVPRPEEEARQGSEGGREHQEEAFERGHEGERPAATIAQRIRFLQSVTMGKRLSYSTFRLLLKRLGWSRKKDRWARRSETSG